ncbi:MAG: peroxide stress protein YaaA [Clostridiales bacterium]|nr:peroxide stress protein YaaA [Clostridiales bacterium]
MKLILSPAKRMRRETDFLEAGSLPLFLDKTEILRRYLAGLSLPELRRLLDCSDPIARRSFQAYHSMDLREGLTPALFAFDGIQYTYMSPGVFSYQELEYVREHLRILSGFYGLLRPFDGVVPYRLEMQARLQTDFCRNLYDFWGDSICKALAAEDRVIVNLASAEYSRTVERRLTPDMTYITCRFGRLEGGRFREKGVHVKMARGQMVRFLAETRAKTPAGLKAFDRMGYAFSEDLSSESTYVFLQDEQAAPSK